MRLDEFLARALAARKMRLTEDLYGMRLPEDLWRQAMPDAAFLVCALIEFDLYEVVSQFHSEDDGE